MTTGSTCLNCGHASPSPFQYCPSCGTKAGSPGGASLTGRILNGKYRLLEPIGAGATGTVYLAEHVGLKRRMALKVLHSDLDLGSEALQRFQREGIAVGKFSHPNVIDVFDFDRTEDGLTFLAMEFVEGENLREYMQERGRLPLAEAVLLTEKILGALAEAHRHGIVHRDLKPDNVMVDARPGGRERVKVLDFGLSKLVDRKLDVSLQTQVGRIMGTPLYMSPEQCAGQEADLRSDLYSVGLLLYEMVAGMRPFAGHETTELLLARVTQEAPSLRDEHPELAVPEELDAFLRRALARNREERFRSAEEMLEALRAVPVDAPPGTPAGRPRSAAATSAAATAALPAGAAPAPAGRIGPRALGIAALGLVLIAVALGVVLSGGESVGGLDPVELQRYREDLENARTFLDGGQPGPALDSVEKALARTTLLPDAYVVRAAVHRSQGDQATAQADLEEALSLAPDSLEAHVELGWLLFDAGELDEAAAQFEEARRVEPGSAAALTALGSLAERRGDVEAARRYLDEAVAKAPDDARAQVELGTLLLRAGELDGAVRAFVQAKRADSRAWRAYAGLGEAYAAQGDPGAAIRQYEEAVTLAPEEPELRVDQASLLVEAERMGEALDAVEDALGRFPREGRLHVLRALALEGEDRLDEAVEALQRARRSGVDDPEVLSLLGALLHETGRTREAREVLEQVVRDAGDVPPANRHLGLLLFAEERYEEAAERFRRVLEFEPEDPVALYNLGLLHADYLGGEEQAADYLRRYLEAGGKNPRAEQLLRRLGG